MGGPKGGAKGTQRDPTKGTQGRLRRPWGGWAHGALWGYSEAIPHGKPFRVEGSFERKALGPKYCKMQPKLTIWSIWVVLGLKWFKMVPKLAMQPSFNNSFRRFWAFQASSNNPFRGYGSSKHLSTTPSEGFKPNPYPCLSKQPFRGFGETCFKQPFRANQTTPPRAQSTV